MTAAVTYHDSDTLRPRYFRDVRLPLPSVTKSRHEIAAGDVTVLELGYLPNGLEDRAICKVLVVDTDYVIARRKDSGRLVLLVKRRTWEVIGNEEWEG